MAAAKMGGNDRLEVVSSDGKLVGFVDRGKANELVAIAPGLAIRSVDNESCRLAFTLDEWREIARAPFGGITREQRAALREFRSTVGCLTNTQRSRFKTYKKRECASPHHDSRDRERATGNGKPGGSTSGAGRPPEDERQVQRREMRLSIAHEVLMGRDQRIASKVLERLAAMDDGLIMVEIQPELASHPERYLDIEAYERVRLTATALVNMYESEDSSNPEDLLDKAHLFVFEDDAWWEAVNCRDPLVHLPYEVCLVEDVLLWEASDGIRAMPAAVGADEGAARVTAGGPGPRGVGRSPRTHQRRGHWRNQACGPGMKQHRRVWISETIVAPSGKARRFADHRKFHVVRLSTEG